MKPMLGYPYGWLIGAGLFFLLIVIMLLSPLTVNGWAKRVGQDDRAGLHVHGLFGMLHYKWELPVIRLKGFAIELKRELNKETPVGQNEDTSTKQVDKDTIMYIISELKQFLWATDQLLKWAKMTARHIRLTEWKWRTALGTDDVVWTAMLVGAVWSVKTTFLGVLSQFLRLQAEPQMNVEPLYNQNQFSTDWEMKAEMRLGTIVFSAIVLVYRIVKVRGIRGSFSFWQRRGWSKPSAKPSTNAS